MREKIVLSKRLKAVASFVSHGSRVCDVGCDHGFIPIYLLQQKIAPLALAMDVREGPLQQARENVAACGLEKYIMLRRSDGLRQYQIGEADTLICAGMGGRLMMRILAEDRVKTASFRELILQPQSDIEQFRLFLREQDYLLLDENMIEEDGKFYPMMKAAPKEQAKRIKCVESSEDVRLNKTVTKRESFEGIRCLHADSDQLFSDQQYSWQRRMEDRYGPILLQKKHPVLYCYLEREMRICGDILEELRRQDEAGKRQDEVKMEQGPGEVRRKKRYTEVKEQMQDCSQVMKLFRE